MSLFRVPQIWRSSDPDYKLSRASVDPSDLSALHCHGGEKSPRGVFQRPSRRTPSYRAAAEHGFGETTSFRHVIVAALPAATP